MQKYLHMNHPIMRLVGAASLLLVLAGCAVNEPSARSGAPRATGGYIDRAEAVSDSTATRRKPAEERPGLGTTLGGEIHDASEATRFYRRLETTPDAVASFHYNDDEGAKLMAGLAGSPRKHSGAFELISHKLEVTVEPRSWRSSAYDHYEANGQIFVIGSPGDSYRLRLRNLTSNRLEVVVSVDGLDVLDGQPAAVRKPGYVIAANSSMTLEGMKAKGTLRELVFSTVAASRAATAFGESGARNVGVIGVAAYGEDEIARRRANVEESYIRDGARAFRN